MWGSLKKVYGNLKKEWYRASDQVQTSLLAALLAWTLTLVATGLTFGLGGVLITIGCTLILLSLI